MVTRLDVTYDAQVLAVRKQVMAYSARLWGSLPAFRDADAERLIAKLVPRVEAGQKRIAELTDAYLTRVAQVELGVNVRRGAVASVTTQDLRGIAPEEVYRRPFVTTYTSLSTGNSLTSAVASGAARLEDIVSTGLQLAKTHSAQGQMRRTSGITGYARVLTGRENCALCVIASTQRYHRGDLMPIHPGCVPGDSVLSAVAGGSTKLSDFAWGQVEAVSRRLFQGELVEFVTASGDEVRVTPNHPVLTDKGWVPAHLLSEGDTVFSSSSAKRIVAGGPNVNERPAFAEDVFDAARVAFPLVRVPLASKDFHADAANGEVEIVYTHGNFPTPGGVEIAQRLSESGFVHAHGGRGALDGLSPLGSFLPSGLASTGGFVSGGSLGGELFGGHVGGSVEASGTAPARFDAPAEEFSLESVSAYASQGLNLVGRLAGDVQGDRIVELRRFSWSGHVFNLHTREGWYSSNNHIVSNCDCGVKSFKGDPQVQVIKPELLEQTHQIIDARLGGSDRSARDLGIGKTSSSGQPLSDFTDLIIAREHGEIGPVLTWRSDKFTSAADIEALAS